MDKYEHSNKQYKTTDTSPELRKARCDIARVRKLKTQQCKIFQELDFSFLALLFLLFF